MTNTDLKQKLVELLHLVADELNKLDKIIDDKRQELQNITNEYSELEELLGLLER